MTLKYSDVFSVNLYIHFKYLFSWFSLNFGAGFNYGSLLESFRDVKCWHFHIHLLVKLSICFNMIHNFNLIFNIFILLSFTSVEKWIHYPSKKEFLILIHSASEWFTFIHHLHKVKYLFNYKLRLISINQVSRFTYCYTQKPI